MPMYIYICMVPLSLKILADRHITYYMWWVTRKKQSLWSTWLVFLWNTLPFCSEFIHMALIIFFHIRCYIYSPSKQLKSAIERRLKRYMWKNRDDLHVSTSIQTERQAGREAWGPAECSSSAFQRLLTGFLLCRPGSLGEGSTHSSLWLQLMKHSCASVVPAPGTCKTLRSKPQQRVVANSSMPSLGRA